MTIKEASKATGISIDNLRYYERIGLIPEIPRNSAGVRDYDDASLGMIDLVMRFKSCGMKLDSIREYMQLAVQGEETRDERKKLLTEARELLKAQLAETQKSLDIVNYKIDNYDKKCVPVTEAMIQEWKTKRKQK